MNIRPFFAILFLIFCYNELFAQHQHGDMPDFGANATIFSVGSGDWNDPMIWSTGQSPSDNDVVVVSMDDAVLISESDASCYDIAVHGTLVIENGWTLKCRTLQVHKTGVFEIIDSGHVEWKDLPPTDEKQFGTGALIIGTWRTIGKEKVSWTRSTSSLFIDDNQVILSDYIDSNGEDLESGWKVGDQIFIGNSSQKQVIPRVANGQIELYRQLFATSHVATVVSVDGNTITFDPPMSHDAPGCSPNPFGIVSYTPIGNLSRSITIGSKNPLGNRGHLMAMSGSHFEAINTEFHGMGRTNPWELVNDQTNQIGRYALHAHRFIDPSGLLYINGCVVRDFGKWGISLHEAFDSTLTNNVFFDGIGAAIVTERGNEARNLIQGNLIGSVRGGRQFGGITEGKRGGAEQILPAELIPTELDGVGDFAMDGSAIWCRAVGNYILDNVAVDCAGYGVNINGFYAETSAVHKQDGTLRSGVPVSPAPGEPPTVYMMSAPPVEVARNEIIGCFGGMWLTYSQGTGRAFHEQYYKNEVYDDFLCWHISRDVVNTWHEANITFNRLIAVFDPVVSAKNEQGSSRLHGSNFFFNVSRLYDNINFELNDCKVYGANVAIDVPGSETQLGEPRPWNTWTFNNCEFYSYITFYLDFRATMDFMILNNLSYTLTPESEFINSSIDGPVYIFDIRAQ